MDPASIQEAKYKAQSVLGIINDTIEVGIAKLRFEGSGLLEIAIIKATRQDEVVPKEKHVILLLEACKASAPREQVSFVIQGLLKRLEENEKAWLVTLKTLIVFHRLIREAGETFIDELLSYEERTGHHHVLRFESFADHTTKDTSDYSSWIRSYSVYLDERLSVFRSLRLSPASDNVEQAKDTRDSEAPVFKLTNCTTQELLEYLPQVQRLLGDLLNCVPVGASMTNVVALNASSLVLMELRSLYDTQAEGVKRVLAQLGDVDKAEAAKGIQLVRDGEALNERLVTMKGVINGIPPLQRLVRFPDVQSVPAEVLANLDDYLKDKPPPVTNLLGLQSFVVPNPSSDSAPAAAPPEASPVPFDPFASFIGPRPPPEPVDPLDELIVPPLTDTAAAADGAAAAVGSPAQAGSVPASTPQLEIHSSSAGATPGASPANTATASAPAPAAPTSPAGGSKSFEEVPVLPPPITPVPEPAPPPAPEPAPKYTLNEPDPLAYISAQLFGRTEPPPPVPMAVMRAKAADAHETVDSPTSGGDQQ